MNHRRLLLAVPALLAVLAGCGPSTAGTSTTIPTTTPAPTTTLTPTTTLAPAPTVAPAATVTKAPSPPVVHAQTHAAPAPRPAPHPALAPAPKKTAPSGNSGGSGHVVHPGAFCDPPGSGVTDKGTPMTCKLDSKGQRYRWGKA